MAKRPAPDIVVGRLPLYLRVLNQLMDEGRTTTNSQELGRRLGLSAAQIRKDLSYFGGFGRYGAGYDVAYLRDQLRRILHLDRMWPVVLIGVGHLGQALVDYPGFRANGFEMVAAFDNDPVKIGQRIGSLRVQDVDRLEQVIRTHQVHIAILAVPGDVAQALTDRLVRAGVKAILNYTPTRLHVPDHVRVQDIDPVARLQHMAFYLA